METITVRGRNFRQINLGMSSARYYLVSGLFIVGNILLPFLVHHFTVNGIIAGKVFLPIYFFVLVAGFQYGLNVALATAILSPLLSNMLTGMPVEAILPIIMIKTTILAVSASFIATRVKKLSIGHILLAVLSYQIIGTLIEYFMTPESYLGDVQVGFLGLILQVVVGFFVLVYLNKALHE